MAGDSGGRSGLAAEAELSRDHATAHRRHRSSGTATAPTPSCCAPRTAGTSCTAPPPALLPDGRAFQTLVSDDLDTWEDAGGALVVAEDAADGTEWWAPEVAHADGRYWMYYSRGLGDTGHQLRVASASDPTGPFEDAGDVLTAGPALRHRPVPLPRRRRPVVAVLRDGPRRGRPARHRPGRPAARGR